MSKKLLFSILTTPMGLVQMKKFSYENILKSLKSIRKSGDDFFWTSNDLNPLTYHGLCMKLETEIPSTHLSTCLN